MKKFITILVLAVLSAGVLTAAPKIIWKEVEASNLTLCGKAFQTPNPYARVDTVKYKGFTKRENIQCRVPAGLTVLFKTDAPTIGVRLQFGNFRNKSAFRSYEGCDLYIKKDGRWLWAGDVSFHGKPATTAVASLVKDMAPGVKECMLYLPVYSEIYSCKVCVPEGYMIDSLESPFRHKILFHGSSFTHGVSTTRAGMSYPMQFMRRTGLQVIPMGFSGNCKMQPYFADVMEDIEADAYVFDPFSNPGIKTIRKRLEGFVERMVKAHPGKPIIFQRTIYWEKENFNVSAQKEFGGRRDLTDSLMPILCKRYKDVYYIKPDAAIHSQGTATAWPESSTADGTHPNDAGYTLWEQSIEKPILKILKKYGIK